MSFLSDAWDSLAMALFPPRCGACGCAMASRHPFAMCADCRSSLCANDGARCSVCDLPGEFAKGRCADCSIAVSELQIRAPFLYGAALAQAVHAMKFSGREDVAVALGHLLVSDTRARALAQRCDALVALPLSASRLKERGYNQSAQIAAVAAKAWGVPMIQSLWRVKHTQAQSSLGRAERLANVADAFAAKECPPRVAIVDDVVTSGETLRAAAAALRKAGASHVVGIAVARTPID